MIIVGHAEGLAGHLMPPVIAASTSFRLSKFQVVHFESCSGQLANRTNGVTLVDRPATEIEYHGTPRAKHLERNPNEPAFEDVALAAWRV